MMDSTITAILVLLVLGAAVYFIWTDRRKPSIVKQAGPTDAGDVAGERPAVRSTKESDPALRYLRSIERSLRFFKNWVITTVIIALTLHTFTSLSGHGRDADNLLRDPASIAWIALFAAGIAWFSTSNKRRDRQPERA